MVVHELGAEQSLGSQSHRTHDSKAKIASASSEKSFKSLRSNQIAP